ncbi:hypothetical protein [Streptomyces tendae]|uniref:hypothetical protein n=1 Tax=Streptomyces tendae TaxID=1932 RepID=UPI00369AC375
MHSPVGGVGARGHLRHKRNRLLASGPLRRTLYLTVTVAFSIAALPVTAVSSTHTLGVSAAAAGILTAAYSLGSRIRRSHDPPLPHGSRPTHRLTTHLAATLAARNEYAPDNARGQIFVWIGALKITAGSAGTAAASYKPVGGFGSVLQPLGQTGDPSLDRTGRPDHGRGSGCANMQASDGFGQVESEVDIAAGGAETLKGEAVGQLSGANIGSSELADELSGEAISKSVVELTRVNWITSYGCRVHPPAPPTKPGRRTLTAFLVAVARASASLAYSAPSGLSR